MLPQEIIKKIRLIDIKTRLLVNEMFSGEYHSIFKGRGIEFSEVREYSYGDDIRTIDWNVTARFGRPFVKVYEEERELTVIILFDISTSTLFGSQSTKGRDIMVELAALLLFSAVENNDKIEAVLFSDIIEKFVPPKKERTHALRILRELLYIQPRHRGTNLKLACDFINNTHPRRSIIFVFSDFYDSGFEKPFKMMAKQHDVIPIVFRDPLEDIITEQRGLFIMHDMETNARRFIDLADKRTREEYIKNLKSLRAERNRLFTSIGLDSIEVSTDRPYIKPLFEFFNRRARKL
jgi:uncharacterized protein (DUF58 family)